jgi:hypothetical protein
MTVALIALVLAAAIAAWLLLRHTDVARLTKRRAKVEPAPKRILFPFAGSALSGAALDAALRLCRAEDATLVPAYLAQVPLTLPLESPLPRQSRRAIPVLDAIEQRADRYGVPVDSRIERGRTYRHAVMELVGHERFDRIIAAASTNGGSDGFSADDVAWILDHAPGEILVLRPRTIGKFTAGEMPGTPL